MATPYNLVVVTPEKELLSEQAVITIAPGADGELGIKTPDGSLIWYLPFMNSPGSYLIVQDDGNVVIYRPDGGVVWATNTSQ